MDFTLEYVRDWNLVSIYENFYRNLWTKNNLRLAPKLKWWESMRIPRSILLFENSGLVHKIWRCHNRSFLLADPSAKDLYLKCTRIALRHETVRGGVKLFGFCIMNNHSHMLLEYEESSKNLSQFMRLSHSRFGYTYNRINNKTGKVANERPKTPLIENSEHSMRVHFYIEANPIRAGFRKLDNLHLYKYSSYGFYAYGKKSEWTDLLNIPEWYINLGRTWKERQFAYRKLFREYLGLQTNPIEFFRDFIGALCWKTLKKDQIKKLLEKRIHSPP